MAGHRAARLRRALGLTLAGLWIAPAVAEAEIYRWTDEQGRIHFTQQLGQVPPQHRAAARAAAQRSDGDALQTFSVPAARSPAARAASRDGGEVRIPFVPQGTLMRVQVRLNDLIDAPFLIDTGASGIAIPREVVDALGIRIGPETRNIRIVTANGVVAEPVIALQSVQLGPVRVENLEATVSHSMPIGLLGGTFFNNFVYQVDAAENVITLAPNEQIRGGLRADEWRKRFQRARERLGRLEEHLDGEGVRRQEERAHLEERRAQLRAELEHLEDQANRLDVPHTWRR